jgi:hypothetical protein
MSMSMSSSRLHLAAVFLLLGAASFLGGCAADTEEPPPGTVNQPRSTDSTESTRPDVDVDHDGNLKPNMVYIDKHGACVDFPTGGGMCCVVFEGGRKRCDYY